MKLRDESFASLGAAPRKHIAAALRCHARAETMHPIAVQIAGIERALHKRCARVRVRFCTVNRRKIRRALECASKLWA